MWFEVKFWSVSRAAFYTLLTIRVGFCKLHQWCFIDLLFIVLDFNSLYGRHRLIILTLLLLRHGEEVLGRDLDLNITAANETADERKDMIIHLLTEKNYSLGIGSFSLTQSIGKIKFTEGFFSMQMVLIQKLVPATKDLDLFPFSLELLILLPLTILIHAAVLTSYEWFYFREKMENVVMVRESNFLAKARRIGPTLDSTRGILHRFVRNSIDLLLNIFGEGKIPDTGYKTKA